jgi:hypothetical protein
LRKTLNVTSDSAMGSSVRGKFRTSSMVTVVLVSVLKKNVVVGQSPTADGCSEGINAVSDADGLVEGIAEGWTGADVGWGFGGKEEVDGADVGEELVNGDGSEDGVGVGGAQYR